MKNVLTVNAINRLNIVSSGMNGRRFEHFFEMSARAIELKTRKKIRKIPFVNIKHVYLLDKVV